MTKFRKNSFPKSKPWYVRYMVLIQWFTPVIVVIGGFWNWYFVDRAAELRAERSTAQLIEQSKAQTQLLQKQLDETNANTASLRANVEGVKAQIALSNATVEHLKDPTRKSADLLSLESQRLARIAMIDGIVDTLGPNLQVKKDTHFVWEDRAIYAGLFVTNAGTRPMSLTSTINVSFSRESKIPSDAPMPQNKNLRVGMCDLGTLSPGETVRCSYGVHTDVPWGGADRMDFKASFSGKTDFPEASDSYKMVRTKYPDAYIRTRLETTKVQAGALGR